jgi:tetratricopeptide (TPR) repeat protein
VAVPDAVAAAFGEAHACRQRELLEEIATRNGSWFDLEMDKLDRWAEDRRASLKAALNELEEALKSAKKAARLAPTLPEKLERQREARVLEGKRDEAWRAFDQASRDIDRQKDALLDETSQRLEQRLEDETLFTLRWRLI